MPPRVPEGSRRTAWFLLLWAIAAGLPLAFWAVSTLAGRGSSFNDFHDFYYAARLITEGQSPYDKAALGALAVSDGHPFVVGTGYSYPLPFAIAMVPFTWLPFNESVLVFDGLSLALYGLAAGAWIARFHRSASNRRRVVLAAAAGAYPSIYGTVVNGQANLVLMPLLALGTIALIEAREERRLPGAIAVGLAAVVKLIPGLFIVPLVLARRLGSAAGVALGAVVALAAATLAAPWAQQGSGGLLNLTEADSYFTNQSINGFVSRLVLHSERTAPLWNHAFDARVVAVVLAGLFGILTFGMLLVARDQLRERRGLALGLALSLVAGLIAAPKGTYWNQAMLVVPAGLLLAVEAPDLRLRTPDCVHFDRLDLGLVAAWLLGTTVQTALWLSPPPKNVELSAIVTLAQSASVYGMFALWAVLARHLLRPRGTPRDPSAASR